MKRVLQPLFVAICLPSILLAPTPSRAGDCTSCTSINGIAYCIAGSVSELCQTVGNACQFSGHRNCGGGGCFLPGTTVLTSAGLAPIASLEVGDRVVSRAVNGDIAWVAVNRTYKTVVHHGYYLLNGVLGVTGEHPFRVEGHWIAAEDLKLGDRLFNDAGEAVIVESIKWVAKGVRVYNIDTLETNTFFAGGFLVHNKDPDPGG